MAKAGGTSAARQRSWVWLAAFPIVGLAAGFLVHRISAGDACGWDYGAVGGACRAIILLAILSGLVAGGLAAVGARAIQDERTTRAWTLAIAAVVVVVLGTLAAKQFEDYRNAGLHEMDARLCTFVRETVPRCVSEQMGENAAAAVRRAQPDCMADSRWIVTYKKCLPLVDCKQLLDCIANAP